MEKIVTFGLREEIVELDIDIDYYSFVKKVKDIFKLRADTFCIEDLRKDNFYEEITIKDCFDIERTEKGKALDRLNGVKTFENIETIQDAEDFLLVYGFKIDEDGWTPLHWAASYGRIEIVKLLFEKNFDDVHQANYKTKETPLYWAVNECRIDIVKILLEKNFNNANQGDINGNTPLHRAAFLNYKEIAKLLIEKGFKNPNQENKNYDSPCYLAVYEGHIDIVELFLKNNIIKSYREYSSLICRAEYNKHFKILKLLEEYKKK